MDLVRLQPNTFSSRTTAAPIDAIWSVASNPLLLPLFSTELQEVRMVSNEPVALGAQFEGDQLRGDRRWTTTSTVTGFEHLRYFEWTVGSLSAPVSRWSFLLDSHAGLTTLTHRVVLCGGPSPLSEFVAEHPDEAEDVVQERLITLRERMSVTVAGLIELVRQ